MFNRIDKENKGFITGKQLSEFLKFKNTNFTSDELNNVISPHDKENNELTINLENYVAVMGKMDKLNYNLEWPDVQLAKSSHKIVK